MTMPEHFRDKEEPCLEEIGSKAIEKDSKCPPLASTCANPQEHTYSTHTYTILIKQAKELKSKRRKEGRSLKWKGHTCTYKVKMQHRKLITKF